jgi:hypothetical protein
MGLSEAVLVLPELALWSQVPRRHVKRPSAVARSRAAGPGRACQHRQGHVAEAADPLPETPGGTDLEQEVAYLMRVAEAYTRSPIVRACRTGVPLRRPAAQQALA